MKVRLEVFPDAIHQGGAPIWSVDIHPDGTRFASAGGDGCVIIWERSQENKKLATLTNHIAGGVNCVRWSPDGQYLAACGDDKQIALYQLQPGTGASFGCTNLENWKLLCTGQGHTGDTTGLTWSPSSKQIASCSIDNKIIIWNITPHGLSRKQTITGHLGPVKGIAWDPLDRYIASQGEDDRKLKIRRLPDFAVEFESNDCFEANQSDKTYFRRLSWSPDGSFLVGTTATSSGRPVSPLIRRGQWHSEPLYLVGHKKHTVSSVWNPNIYKAKDGELFMVWALGALDSTITIWKTNACRPILIIKELFDHQVLDLSWSQDGKCLLAASIEGSIGSVSWNMDLGVPLTKDEFNEYIHRLYGSDIRDTTSSDLIEGPQHLKLQEIYQLQQKEKQNQGPQNDDYDLELSSDEESMIEDSPFPTPPPKEPTPRKFTQPTPPSPSGNTQSFTSKSGETILQTVVTLPGGKKRLTPQSIGPSVVAPTINSAFQTGTVAPAGSMLPPAPRALNVSFGGIPPLAPTNGHATPQKELNKSPLLKRRRSQDLKYFAKKRKIDLELNRTARSSTGFLIPKPNLSNLKARAENLCVTEVELLDDGMSLIRSTSDSKLVWEEKLKAQITTLTRAQHFVAVGTMEGDLLVYTPMGRRMLPTIHLGAHPIVLLSCSSYFLIALTCAGTLTLWNLNNKTQVFSSDIATLLQEGQLQGVANISYIKVNRQGHVILALKELASQSVFTYNTDMEVWMPIFDQQYLAEFSRFDTTRKGPLYKAKIITAGNGFEQPLTMYTAPNPAFRPDQDIETVGFLEHQMAASITLNSPTEYKEWLEAYVQKLITLSHQQKLCDLCQWLLGPQYIKTHLEDQVSEEWDPKVLGLSKRKLLGEVVLPLMCGSNFLQTIIERYQNVLREIDSQN